MGSLLALVVAGTLTACVTMQVEGTSSAEMKRQMQGSFLFASADLFYPQGLPADPATLPDLGPAQIAELQKQVSAMLGSLRQANTRFAPALTDLFDTPVAAEPAVRVMVVNTGRPLARIAGNGEISLDAKVIQAMFRAALVATFETEIMLPRIKAGVPNAAAGVGDTEGQRVAVREMLALKARVGELEGRSAVREAFADTDLRSAGEDGTGWFAMRSLLQRSEVALRSYTAQQIFLLGHELGHSVLGHHELGAGLDCEALQGVERDADLYAAFMLAIATPDDAVQDLFGMFGRSLGEGLETMFEHTYEFAGFAAPGVAARCPPPDPAERKRIVREGYDAVRSAQIDEILKEAKPE